MRVFLIGGRSFAIATLERLLDEGHEVVGVWSKDRMDGLYDAAKRDHVTRWYGHPGGLGAAFRDTDADLAVGAHNYALVPDDALRAPTYGVIGYHPSLLPRWRGNDAVRWTIEAGDPIAGGSVYKLDDGWDTGPVVLQRHVHVVPGWTASDLWRSALFPMGVRMLADAVRLFEQHGSNVEMTQQDDRCATTVYGA